MFLFYVLSFFKKGDTIQGGTSFKGGQYLRKYGILAEFSPDREAAEMSYCKCLRVIGTTRNLRCFNIP